jgi:aminopeptidase N
MKNLFFLLLMFAMSSAAFAQAPPIEPGVPQTLARWRAERYRDVRYRLNLTLEKMSPVLKGTIEIRANVSPGPAATADKSEPPATAGGENAIILDWRKIKGNESLSTVSNVSINGKIASLSGARPPADAGGSDLSFDELNEHLIFRDGVVAGENVIKLDFTSPILPSGSAVTRYVDKEDGSEYLYSLFVPSDASTAFPVFDQPDLKARFKLTVGVNYGWTVISNSRMAFIQAFSKDYFEFEETKPISTYVLAFAAGPWEEVSVPPTVAGGDLSRGSGGEKVARRGTSGPSTTLDLGTEGAEPNETSRASGAQDNDLDYTRRFTSGYHLEAPSVQGKELKTCIYVRKSQAAKFKPHAAEVFRLNREGVKFLEEYFDYKYPFPKYDIVLIPEFPFGGMEHAGATFLRESAVIFPSEPTANDHISRANVIFHEAAHQWFGDTVTMRWFDDLWLKEGFAEFMAYKTLEKVMPQYNAWKAFYERNKPLAYATDSTRGTTPIYQEIPNLSAAKSAYGNIVYRKAPSFLRQAEFYLGPDKFQMAVRAFLKKHEFSNAEWKDLANEFVEVGYQSRLEKFTNPVSTEARKDDIREGIFQFLEGWVRQRGMPIFKTQVIEDSSYSYVIKMRPEDILREGHVWKLKTRALIMDDVFPSPSVETLSFDVTRNVVNSVGSNVMNLLHYGRSNSKGSLKFYFFFPNYQDYGYGIFLLDDKSRDYVLKNIRNEKDDFLRSMMWGALWDSVREGELDPREYVELAIKNISVEKDELTIQTILGRVSTAMTYYIPQPDAERVGSPHVSKGSTSSNANVQPSLTVGLPTPARDLQPRLEAILTERMQNAPTLGQRITYYRAFLNIVSTENGRSVLKEMLRSAGGNLSGSEGALPRSGAQTGILPTGRVSVSLANIPLKTKDKFDIVTKLAILGDPDAAKLLADLAKTETSDDAKRYAYAARAAFPAKETKEKFWNDFVGNTDISESWIEAAFGPFNSPRHADLTLPFLERALAELPNLKRSRKIFFVNGWLAAFIGGQRSEQALNIVNKFLADNPNLDRDLRLKVLENVDVIERAVKIRSKVGPK